jgi:hypothetical protein
MHILENMTTSSGEEGCQQMHSGRKYLHIKRREKEKI